MWPYSVPCFVCVQLKELKMFIIIGQRDSRRFAITPLWTLQLFHYCLVTQKETVYLEPDALWVVMIIIVKF
jgi:hypothetical protein